MSEELNIQTESALTTQTAAVAPSETFNFKDHISDEFKNEASLADIKDVNSLAKGYVNAQRMIGSSLRIPTDDTAPEQRDSFYKKLNAVPGVVRVPNEVEDEAGWNQLYNKLGRPESFDQYNFELPEGVEIDAQRDEQFKQFAHKLGLTQDQAKELVAFDSQRQEQFLEQQDNERQGSESVLRERWGHDFDNRMHGAKTMAKILGEKYPEHMGSLINGPSGNNPALAIILSELNQTYAEKGNVQATGAAATYGTSAHDAKEKIAEIQTNSSHAYHNGFDKEHQQAVERMQKLFQIAYPAER